MRGSTINCILVAQFSIHQCTNSICWATRSKTSAVKLTRETTQAWTSEGLLNDRANRCLFLWCLLFPRCWFCATTCLTLQQRRKRREAARSNRKRRGGMKTPRQETVRGVVTHRASWFLHETWWIRLGVHRNTHAHLPPHTHTPAASTMWAELSFVCINKNKSVKKKKSQRLHSSSIWTSRLDLLMLVPFTTTE